MTAGAAAFVVVMLFVIAGLVEPDVRGHGTHQQLGLPECFVLQLTGWKCPQCGMTTSFAHIVRGQVFQAWRTHPCGPILAVLLVFVVLPWSVTAGLTGRSLLTDRPGLVAVWLFGLYLVGIVLVWIVRSASF